MKRLIIICAALLTLTAATGQNEYRVRNITMDDGLPSNAVRNIVQDSYGFIWMGTDNGLCRYDGTRVQQYYIAEASVNQYITALLTTPQMLYVGTETGVYTYDLHEQRFERLPIDITSAVTCLTFDRDSALWVSTHGQGVWRYQLNSKQQHHYAMNESRGNVTQLLCDSDNQLWAMTMMSGCAVMRLNRLHDRFETVKLNYPADYSSTSMLQTRDGRLWLGSWEQGLLLMHGDGSLEQMLSPQQTGAGQHIHTLYELADGTICVGCDNGIVTYEPKTNRWNTLSQRFAYSLLSDNEGGLWVGTFYNGVQYVSPTGSRFTSFSIGQQTPGLRGNVISRFCEDSVGRVWTASDDGGLMCYDTKQHRFVDYPHSQELQALNVHALDICGDELWIGTYNDGVSVLNLNSGQLLTHRASGKAGSLDNNSSYAIFTDSHNRTWVATMSSLLLYNRALGTFQKVHATEAVVIDIDETPDGLLWLSTQGGGLCSYNPDSKRWRQYKSVEDDESTLPDNHVNAACVDAAGKLWVGTTDGLCSYDGEDGFERVSLNVPSQSISAIVEDHGALWLSTERGILKYIPGEGVQHFTRHDGLVSEQFLPNSGLLTSSGVILFGTTNGMNAFHPYQIKVNSVMPRVYITTITVQGREWKLNSGMPYDLSLRNRLELGHKDRMFTLSFASLSYCSPEKNQYAYMLEGFDKTWNYAGSTPQATYTNIPAGTYTFRVRATNNDGTWSNHEARLVMRIYPPRWWSWWAKTIYLFLIVLAIWLFLKTRLHRAERRHKLEMQLAGEEKDKEVRDARLNFFTMIAHEIRTPVSLIIGPLEQLRGEMSKCEHASDSQRNSLDVIERNAQRLLELVNQLLDFRKVEQNSMEMHPEPVDVCQLLTTIAGRFAPAMQQDGKTFSLQLPEAPLMAMIDREGMTKVVSNLVTNAVKYTKTQVTLRCIDEAEAHLIRIEVSDDGPGIRHEDRKRIFDAFYQAENNKPGTGIGLNIVKNIVSRMGCSISLASELGHGSTFAVVIPAGDVEAQDIPAVPNVQDNPEIPEVQEITADTDKTASLLIVEDNDDMRTFLAGNLSQTYNVMTASDGMEAIEVLSHYGIDLIVSDWMMPRMDGAELCRRVRANVDTSHIPFVMLTAKTDTKAKVEGMNVGADMYIEKPFSMQYLEAAIRNVLDIRRRLKQKFTQQPLEPLTDIALGAADNEFLERMRIVIEDNFTNPDLNADYLAAQLNISHSGLIAKTKTLADVTPDEMIQLVRLKRAAHLLREGRHDISEVGNMVGFSSTSSFQKCFQKQFGIKPDDLLHN